MLRFKTQSIADQLNNNDASPVTDSEEIINTLGNLFGRKWYLTGVTGRGSNPLLRISGFALEEHPGYLKLSDGNG